MYYIFASDLFISPTQLTESKKVLY